ncbi:hypothetical protein ACFL5O_10950 [Myxococcota bacterium]
MYDAYGQAKVCGPPSSECPPVRPAATFLDRCRLAGYQVRRCGCEQVCSGQVELRLEHYDAQGQSRKCVALDPDCQPPETTAAFQDSCTDGGHHLVLCGCEWLCDGPLKP